MTEGGTTLVAEPNASTLDLFLLQLVFIICLTRIISKFLRRLQQPSVIAEIIAGILLGPSCFGFIPGFSHYMFPDRSLPTLQTFANVGLILFMFFLGLEVEPSSMVATWRTSVPLAIAGLVIPWAGGSILSLWLYPVETVKATPVVFLLFTGTSFSFTAMPVLGRILAARKLLHTKLGVEALAIAAVDDLLAWTTLAVVLAYANGGTPINGLYTILISTGFVLFLCFPVRKFNIYLFNRLKKKNKEESRNFTAFILLSLCIASWFSDLIGIHAFFGAFIYGIMVPRGHFIDFIAPKIELLVVEFFLPLYFAFSGIRTSLGSLDGPAWGMVVVVTIVAALTKILPATLGTRLITRGKADWHHCFSIGLLINTRGLVALIVLNIGLSAGIFGQKVFSIMVVMALVTTFMTSPGVHLLTRNRKLEKAEAELDTIPQHNFDGVDHEKQPNGKGGDEENPQADEQQADDGQRHVQLGVDVGDGQPTIQVNSPKSVSKTKSKIKAEEEHDSDDDSYDRGLSLRRHSRSFSQQPPLTAKHHKKSLIDVMAPVAEGGLDGQRESRDSRGSSDKVGQYARQKKQSIGDDDEDRTLSMRSPPASAPARLDKKKSLSPVVGPSKSPEIPTEKPLDPKVAEAQQGEGGRRTSTDGLLNQTAKKSHEGDNDDTDDSENDKQQQVQPEA